MHIIQVAVQEGTHYAIEALIKERNRSVFEEGYTPEADDNGPKRDEHYATELINAGECYLLWAIAQLKDQCADSPPVDWPWSLATWNPSDDPARNIEKSLNLIAAGYDKLKRDEAK